MTPDRWRRIEEIFFEAVNLDPCERDAFVADVCDDARLCEEVMDLLRRADSPNQSLRGIVLTAVESLSAGKAPETIGPWQVLRELGSGGMGTVYLAERRDGEFQQKAAIKLIRSGFEGQGVAARFRQERQLMANLNHPNIARVFDGGTTPDGRPYFVMEYIEGQPVTSWLKERGAGRTETLRVFLDLCSAVDHAHRRLIVHRDIKPGNILVTADGVVKLLDFGIAKLLSPDVGTSTLPSEALTPLYASPEQVRGEAITTATDVYSLGALLYELLTGQRAHQFNGLSPGQVMQMICEAEPPYPTSLPTDLARIVLKAMAKEPARRYSGAAELAADVQRFLSGRPVMARSDGFPYIAGKFIRRNRLAVAASMLVMIAVIAGVCATFWQARRAERRLADVRGLTNRLLFDFYDETAKMPGSTRLREMTASTALEYLDRLSSDAVSDPQLQIEVAIAYARTGEALGAPLAPSLGRMREAIHSYENSVAILKELLRESPGNERVRRSLVEAQTALRPLYVWAGENDRAIEGAESAARLAADLPATGPANLWAIYLAELGMGDQLMVTNQVNAAVPHYRAALARCIEAARLDWLPHREVPVAHGRLGIALESRGELVEAHALFAEQLRVAEELSEAQPGDQRFLGEAMKAHELIGEVAGDPQVPNLADLPGARRHLEESLRIARRMRDRDPSDADANLAVAVELTRVAGLDIQPDPSRAVENLLQARALVEALQPSDIQKEKMSLVCGFLALAYSHQRQFGKAAAAAEDAERAASAAKSPILSEALCRAHGTSGRVALERGDRKMARAALELALACQAHEVAAAPEYLGDLFPYSELLSLLARAYADEPDKAGLYRLRRIQLWREWPIRGDFSAKQLAAALRDRG